MKVGKGILMTEIRVMSFTGHACLSELDFRLLGFSFRNTDWTALLQLPGLSL